MRSSRGRSPLCASVTGAYLSLSLVAGIGLLAGPPARAQLPTVASINLCTDQLVLSVAAPEQILSLSWLSADAEDSMLAQEAAQFPLNYGSAEELVGIGADVVIAGTLTSPFTRDLLRRLGVRLIEIGPETSLDDTYRNLRAVGEAIERSAEAEGLVAAMRARAQSIRARAPNPTRTAIVVRPGGFTIGHDSLANEILGLAGLENGIAELDRWGSLSVEALLSARPEFIVITRYRMDEASLANSIFAHPALTGVRARQKTLTIDSRNVACGAPASLDAAESLLRQMAVP